MAEGTFLLRLVALGLLIFIYLYTHSTFSHNGLIFFDSFQTVNFQRTWISVHKYSHITRTYDTGILVLGVCRCTGWVHISIQYLSDSGTSLSES